MTAKIYNFRQPLDKFKRGTKFGAVDDAHPNGHRGDDYNGVPEGTALKAVANGKVAAIMFSKALGNIVVFQVGSRFFGYCHMQKPCKWKVGSVLKSGTIIGFVGNTGTASSGDHLHLTLGDSPLSVIQGEVYSAYDFIADKIEEEKKAA